MTSVMLPDSVASLALLGTGVWGQVFDCGDGTVLKLTRPPGGLGNALEKLAHEARILAALAAPELPLAHPIAPKLIGHGVVPLDHHLRQQHYTGWLRCTKIDGTVYRLADLSALHEAQQALLATHAGATLWYLHKLLRAAQLQPPLKPDALFSEPLPFKLSPDDTALQQRVFAFCQPAQPEVQQPIHGDFNITNIIFASDQRVRGIVDFAETCLGCAEDDIVSLTAELPGWAATISAAYQTAGGAIIDPARLRRASAKRAFIGMVLCRYKLDRPDEARDNEKLLHDCLAMS